MEMPVVDPGDGGFPVDPGLPVEEEKGIEPWKIAVAAGVVLLVAGFIFRKIRKAKRLKKELEELDE